MLAALVTPTSALPVISSAQSSASETIYILAALYMLIETIKFLVQRLGKTNGSASVFTVDDKHRIAEMYEWHKKTDETGRPLWYAPHGLHEALEKMMEILRQITELQREQARYQKDSARILERIIDRLDKREQAKGG